MTQNRGLQIIVGIGVSNFDFWSEVQSSETRSDTPVATSIPARFRVSGRLEDLILGLGLGFRVGVLHGLP